MNKRIKDRTNVEYGSLTVLYFVGIKNRRAKWMCRCVCGKVVEVCGDDLQAKHTRSCSCLQKEQIKIRRTTHGKSQTKQYRRYKAMINRCHSKNHKAYKDYGGRGIKVCLRWRNSFTKYIKDIGKQSSSEHTLDRINNDGDYEPSNCKWSTKTEQMNNTRKNKWFYACSPVDKWYKAKSISIFCRTYKICNRNVSSCLLGKRKTANGWKFWRA